MKVTWQRALVVSLAGGCAALIAAWSWDQFRQLLASRGQAMPDLLFMLGLLVVMVGAAHLVAGRLFKDLRKQAE
jgi:hypothetical protein